MVRLATTKADRRQKPATIPDGHAHPQVDTLGFSLISALQSSLEPAEVLETFFRHLSQLVQVDGMRFRNSAVNIHLTLGRMEPHSARYTLAAGAENFGELDFRRKKPFLESELALIEAMVGILFPAIKNALLYREAVANSIRDPLTGVGNRAAFDLAIEREMKLAQRNRQTLGLLIIDADHFKQVNDGFGHSTGDSALRHLVGLMKSSLRETDQLFRFGGEEFVALLNNTGQKDLISAAERVRTRIAKSPLVWEKGTVSLSVSIGAAVMDEQHSTEQLFDIADQALYEAKRGGRNRVVFAA